MSRVQGSQDAVRRVVKKIAGRCCFGGGLRLPVAWEAELGRGRRGLCGLGRGVHASVVVSPTGRERDVGGGVSRSREARVSWGEGGGVLHPFSTLTCDGG